MQTQKIFFLSLIMFLLAACGGGQQAEVPTLAATAVGQGETPDDNDETEGQTTNDGNETQPSEGSADVDLSGLDAGGYEVTLSGAVTSLEGFTTGEGLDPVSYDPRGGGDGNSYGLHELILYTDAEISSEELSQQLTEVGADAEAPVPFQVRIQFPHDITPGSYDIVADAEESGVEGEVQHGTSSSSQAAFDDAVSGTLEIATVGEALSVSFEMDNTLEAGGQTYTLAASGRVNQIPFDYRPVVTASISAPKQVEHANNTPDDTYWTWEMPREGGNVEFEVIFAASQNDINNDYFRMTLQVPEGTEPGTYDVAANGTTIMLDRLSFRDEESGIDLRAEDNATGTFTFEYTVDGRMQGSYELSGSAHDSDETISVSGTFEYFDQDFRAEQ